VPDSNPGFVLLLDFSAEFETKQYKSDQVKCKSSWLR